MISPNDIQESILMRLQATTALTALLAATTSIKADQWQGTTFVYPAVRINLGMISPIASCDGCTVTFGIECYSELASEKEANNIADAVNDALHGKEFTSGNVRFSNYSRGLVPAIRSDERTWRAEALFHATISPA
jgi:hypothetical protein